MRETLAFRHERRQDAHDDDKEKPIHVKLPKVGAPWPSRSCIGDAVMSLIGNQKNDEKTRQVCSARVHVESVDDIDTVSTSGMSPDLGEMWRRGCPKSPQSEEEEEGNVESQEEETEGAISSFRPMSLKCALQDSSGILQKYTVLLPNCGVNSGE